MANFSLLVLFTIISLGLATLFFFQPQIIASIPYGAFTFAFAVLINLWVAIRLGKSDIAQDETLRALGKTLRSYFWIMTAFFLLDGIAHVGLPTFYPNEIIASHFHTVAHILWFVGNAVIVRIPVSFINPRLKNPATIVELLIGLFTVGWRFIHTDKLVYIFGAARPPIIVTDQTSGTLFGIAALWALLLPGLYLVYRSIRSHGEIVRVRAFFLGLGMMFFFSIGPVIDLVQNQYAQLIIHWLIALSFFFMAASAFYSSKPKVAAGERVAAHTM